MKDEGRIRGQPPMRLVLTTSSFVLCPSSEGGSGLVLLGPHVIVWAAPGAAPDPAGRRTSDEKGATGGVAGGGCGRRTGGLAAVAGAGPAGRGGRLALRG